MKDSSSTVTASIPSPFTLEREVTLMPSEFRERLSAKHKSRKSSGVIRSAPRRKTSGKSNGTFTYSTENSNANVYKMEFNDADTENMENSYGQQYPQPKQTPEYEDYGFHGDDDGHFGNNNNGELTSTSSHIELNNDMKFMIDNNAYENDHSEKSYEIRTPPTNMHINDLMIPLDDYLGSNNDMIREKKYAVLPSITKSPHSEYTDHTSGSTTRSNYSDFQFNNQLDFGRDKMEQEADFFADFRVNTSSVKATPRQDPLPPIRQGTSDTIKVPSGENYKHSNINTKMKSKSKTKHSMYL